MSSTVDYVTNENWNSSGRLDPKSPYIGNFHRGHTCSSNDVLEYRSRRNAMYRSCSESNVNLQMVNGLNSDAVSGTLSSAERTTGVENSDSLVHSTLGTETESIQLLSFQNSKRFNLDGVPSTPELCALQAILPKQVLQCLSKRSPRLGQRTHTESDAFNFTLPDYI